MIMDLLVFGLGMLVGLFVLNLIQRPIGTFIIDDSDSEKTKWTLSVHGDPENIQKMKHVRFKVHIKE